MALTIPAEGTYTDVERNFIEVQPPGLWPENQDSIFGQFRKVICDQIQGRVDEVDRFAAEGFVPTADLYLPLWEEMLGTTIAPPYSDASRRAILESLLKYGTFTRANREAIIESFMQATQGQSAVFGPTGIPITAGGIPLYGAIAPVKTLYRIYEDVVNYHYDIWIKNTNSPNLAAMTKALDRITPAGISYTIDNTKTQILDWAKAVTDLAPSGWWRLGADYLDSSGLGHTGTVTGAPTAIASPGLVAATVTGVDAARDFSGTGQYVAIPDSPNLDSATWTIMGLVRPDALPASGFYMMMYSDGGGGNFTSMHIGIQNVSGANRFEFTWQNGVSAGGWPVVVGTTTPVIGTTYHLAGTFDGKTMRLYVNGVLEASLAITGVLRSVGGPKYIGSWTGPGDHLWNGGLDEVIYCGYPLSDVDILRVSNTSKNIA